MLNNKTLKLLNLEQVPCLQELQL